MFAFTAAKKLVYRLTSTDTLSALQKAQVPLSEAPCRDCPEPCDREDAHEAFPAKFKIDQERQLLGTVKAYHKQCIISTGKQDWPKDISSVNGTLAAYISQVDHKVNPPSDTEETDPHPSSGAPGIYTSHKPTRLSILNGSHHSNTHGSDPTGSGALVETVLVFPDYKLVHVPATHAGASELWEEHLNLRSNSGTVDVNGMGGKGGKLPTWLLPYECVILLCSHKRRDNRCGIASKVLSHALRVTFEKHQWEVHTELDDVDHLGNPLPDGVASRQEREEVLRHSQKRVLILMNSHMGGHKFAGNMILYTASGAGVWYGRVTSHNVEPIVQETVMGGKVLPELLRGGINLGCRKDGSILEW